jgi:alpha-L-fucosidase
MKKKLSFLILSITMVTKAAIAQWSVIEGDPRPIHNKREDYLYQVFTPKEWDSSNFATPQQMKWYNEARYGMFISFGLSSYVNKDLSWPIVYNRKAPDGGHGAYPDSAWQKTWPSQFKLEKFNATEWVNIAKAAGMKYIVIIAKHHDGFHMWDTKFSVFKITNTPFGRDYIKELVDACHKMNMRVGLYYSQRDWYNPDYSPVDPSTIKRISHPPFYEALPGKKVAPGPSHQKYIDYQFNVVKELLSNYGKIDLFWFDAVYWGGMFKADMWDSEKLTRMMRKLQPGIIINNRTSLPGDFDTPEQRIGMYQKRPWESAMTLNGSWAYDPAPVKPVKSLIKEILTAAAGNGNVLLSWGAHFDGEFDKAQKDTLIKIGSWLKQYGVAYYGTHGGPWMPNRNFGSVNNGRMIYLYVFNWTQEGFSLPELEGNAITKAEYINIKEKLSWKKENGKIHFSPPAVPDGTVTLIALTLNKPVKEALFTNNWSLFDDPSYGEEKFQKNLKPTDWKDNNYIIDLGKLQNTTGVGIYGNKNKLTLSISSDGKIWENVDTTSDDTKEISLTTFSTGAQVPGKSLRYIRLNVSQVEFLKVRIYTK